MHYALICPDMTGHLNPMTTLGAALRRRGHRVSLIGSPQSCGFAAARGLEFLPIGEAEHFEGRLAAEKAELSRLMGLSALRYTGRMLCHAAEIIHRDAPAVLRNAGVDAVIRDQVSPAGESVAELLGLPHAIVCNALLIHSEPCVPPPVTDWKNRTGFAARCRNRLGNTLLRIAGRPLENEVNSFRRRHGVRKLWHPLVQDGGCVQVAQQPAFFDFPRQELPDHFHYTGPWHSEDQVESDDFPWDRLGSRPIVYASLGTLQNGRQHLFHAIVDACRALDVQLVLSRGGSQIDLGSDLPPGAIVADYIPQIAMLKRAAAVVTHAGLNTALESLSHGVPMLAIPITNDQPGVARRLEYVGAARLLRPGSATADRIRSALHRILTDLCYRKAAERWRTKIQSGPNVDDAAALLDSALGKPVSAEPCRARHSPPVPECV